MKTWMLALLAAVAAAPASAQTLTLSPAVVQLSGSEGQSTTQRLTIRNDTAMELAFEMQAKDVAVKDGKRLWLAPGQMSASIAATAVFSVPRVVVPAGASRDVSVTVTLPVGMSGRAIVALFQGVTTIHTAKGNETASLGSLLTFATSRNVSLSAAALQVTGQTVSANASFVEPVTNDGTEPLVAKGAVAVLDASGRMAGRAALDAHRLLPGERATLRAQWPGTLDPGTYRVLVSVEYDGGAVTREGVLVVPGAATSVGKR